MIGVRTRRWLLSQTKFAPTTTTVNGLVRYSEIWRPSCSVLQMNYTHVRNTHSERANTHLQRESLRIQEGFREMIPVLGNHHS